MRALGIAVVVCTALGTAAAQSPADVERANALFLEGRELLTRRDTQAACDKFEASIALDPAAPGVMLNLGLCYELLKKYATSLYWFRKAQVAAAEGKLTAYEDEAKRHTVALAAKVSIVRIAAAAAPTGTEIRIDGKLVAPTDYARVEIDRGRHMLEARATGKRPFRRSFDVTGGDAGTLAIPALTDESGEGGASDSDARVDAPSPRGRIVLAAGLAGAGTILCVASPLWARSVKSSYDDAVANMEMPSYSAARTKQHVATGMFVVGAGLLGAGAYLYLTRPRTAAEATALVPLIDAHHVGFALTGSL
jgi:tetratricopeptide (TPR) repeat protein